MKQPKLKKLKLLKFWTIYIHIYIYIYIIYIIHNTYIIHIHIYTLFIYIYTNYVYIYNFIRRSRHSGPEILWYFTLSKLAEREVSCKLLISVKREILIGPWLLMPERSGVMTYLNVTYHNGSQGRPAPQLFDYWCFLLLTIVKRNWRNVKF